MLLWPLIVRLLDRVRTSLAGQGAGGC
jgi:hypothetical protein